MIKDQIVSVKPIRITNVTMGTGYFSQLSRRVQKVVNMQIENQVPKRFSQSMLSNYEQLSLISGNEDHQFNS